MVWHMSVRHLYYAVSNLQAAFSSSLSLWVWIGPHNNPVYFKHHAFVKSGTSCPHYQLPSAFFPHHHRHHHHPHINLLLLNIVCLHCNTHSQLFLRAPCHFTISHCVIITKNKLLCSRWSWFLVVCSLKKNVFLIKIIELLHEMQLKVSPCLADIWVIQRRHDAYI